MLQEISLLIATFTSLFSIVNPFNATPVFLALTEKDDEATKIRIAKKTSVYMLGVLIVFFLAGSYIMDFFGLSLPGIRIAGGLMLASSAFGMLNPETRGQKVTKEEVAEGTEKDDPSFTPLAMPLLSGPGSIATVLAFATESQSISQDLMIGVSIMLICLTSYIVLRVSPLLTRVMGKTGLAVLTKIMGFIVLCVAIQFIINGVVPILKS